MAPKRKHKKLSHFQKVWLAKMKLNHKYTYAQCREAFWKEFKLTSDDYSLPDSTLSDFLGKKTVQEWAEKSLEAQSESSFRNREAEQPAMEQANFAWLVKVTEGRTGTVTDGILLRKAEDFGGRLGVPQSFKYSRGWLGNWKKRWGVKKQTRHGEAKSADQAGIDFARANLHLILQDFPPERRYNMDESGLYWK